MVYDCGKSISLQGLLESPNQNGGNHTYFRNNLATTILIKSTVKLKTMYDIFPKLKANYFG